MPSEDDVSDLSNTTIPKSDQLNADDLLVGPITVTITSVSRGSVEQPVIVRISGDHLPYKPCKSMLRVLMEAWGKDGRAWVGRSLTLYNDRTIKFGSDTTGGIRISHLSHIEKPLILPLTMTKGKRKAYRVDPLKAPPTLEEVLAPTTLADLDRFRASEGKPAVADGDAPKIAAFLRDHPNAIEKIRAWVAANPITQTPAENAGSDEMP